MYNDEKYFYHPSINLLACNKQMYLYAGIMYVMTNLNTASFVCIVCVKHFLHQSTNHPCVMASTSAYPAELLPPCMSLLRV